MIGGARQGSDRFLLFSIQGLVSTLRVAGATYSWQQVYTPGQILQTVVWRLIWWHTPHRVLSACCGTGRTNCRLWRGSAGGVSVFDIPATAGVIAGGAR